MNRCRRPVHHLGAGQPVEMDILKLSVKLVSRPGGHVADAERVTGCRHRRGAAGAADLDAVHVEAQARAVVGDPHVHPFAGDQLAPLETASQRPTSVKINSSLTGPLPPMPNWNAPGLPATIMRL